MLVPGRYRAARAVGITLPGRWLLRSWLLLRFLPLQFFHELLEIFPLAQGIQIGVLLYVRYVLVALAHRISEELHGLVAVELRRFFALVVVQLVVLSEDGDALA